jgi:hypothetical protein
LVGSARVPQPDAAFQHRQHLGRQVTALGQEVAGALAAIQRGVAVGGIEEDQDFGRHSAILGEAEAQRLDARPPGEVGDGSAGAHHRIGEAGAVHVEGKAALPAQFTECRDFVRRVDQAVFGGVGDRQSPRLGLVDIVAHSGEQRRNGVGRQLGAFPFGEQQLGAMGVEFGCAAFVILDMGIAVADDAAIRRAQLGQGQRVGRRAGRHPQRRHFRFEQVGKGAVQPLAPAVAVIGRIEAVRLMEGGHDLGAGGGGIIGKETHFAAHRGAARQVNRGAGRLQKTSRRLPQFRCLGLSFATQGYVEIEADGRTSVRGRSGGRQKAHQTRPRAAGREIEDRRR